MNLPGQFLFLSRHFNFFNLLQRGAIKLVFKEFAEMAT